MKLAGYIKIVTILIVDFAAACNFLGVEFAILVTAGIALYAWLGEYLSLLKAGAIKMDNLGTYEKSKLTCALDNLSKDVLRHANVDISRLKVSVIPSECINAYAYGFRNIGVTRAMLNHCDDATLCAVLGHEVSHIINLDAVISRTVFASVTVIMGALIVLSFCSVSFVWLIFAALCAAKLCGGLFSMFLFQGFSKLIRGSFLLMQHALLFIYQALMGIVSRRHEYRADRFSCELGYGPQLSYFLSRFIEGQESRQKTLTDIIYASHPATYKRILRIEQGATED